LKILSAQQIREADAYTIANEPISSLMLMERAATACFEWISTRFDKENYFYVFCGTRNNGGDGLVISRLLLTEGYKVSVVVVEFSKNRSADFSENEKRFLQLPGSKITYVSEISLLPELPEQSVAIDALFGTGLNKSPEGIALETIQKINKSGAFVISIDIPSGLYCDSPSENIESIINADITLTFQVPKLSFLLPSNYIFTGEWFVIDIGLNLEFIEQAKSSDIFIDNSFVKSLLKPRNKFSHKGNFGHALLIAGSYGKIGAAVLSARSCLRSGAGLLTVHISKCGYEIIQNSVPEAMASIDGDEKQISTFPDISIYNAIAAGPGIDKKTETQNVIKLLIQNSTIPLIFDADALNILSENKTWLAFLPKGSILTPHPKEFERLFGKPDNDYERLQMQKDCSVKYNCYIIYKGAHSTISTPEGKLYFNSSGNPGMATGGSGDVLTGILLGLKARGYQSLDTCIIGTYLHGIAGDIAKASKGEESLIASDIVDFISDAFAQIDSAL
jgi:ADP-dependent NAD(P)H-hydrate dehydratase / NAD(P)H-hydrate epimerase